jgi:hypothetical protein
MGYNLTIKSTHGHHDMTTAKEQVTSQITKVTAFETTDGNKYLTKQEAMEHQNILNLTDWYYGSELYGNHTAVDVNDVAEWLTTNKNKVLDFLNASE